MGLMRNKKGIFFMLMTIVIISLFVLSASFFSTVALRKSVQKRVETLSDFVSNTESDLSRQISIFGHRAVLSMISEISGGGAVDYLSISVEDAVNEAFFNATIGGNPSDILTDTTFYELQDLLRQRAATISAVANLTNPRINMTQDDPWNVKIVFSADLFVEDKNKLVSWNKTFSTDVYIHIQNFTDPVYIVGTGGTDNPRLTKTNITIFDITTLGEQLDNRYYRNHTGAPSFIDRLEGNIVSPRYPEYGVESLVHLQQLGLPDTGQSIVDYIYFSSSGAGCRVSGAPYSWVRLDSPGHTTAYGVFCV